MKNAILILLMFACSIELCSQTSVEPNIESNRTNVILANGLFGDTKTGLGFRYKSLYKLNDIIKLGWGVGIESYSSDVKRNFIPLSLDVIGDINLNGKTPFYMVSVGYGIALKEDESFASKQRGGLMLDLSIGYRSKKYSSQPFIALGYRIQNAFYEGNDDYGNNDKDVIYKRWAVSVGILF